MQPTNTSSQTVDDRPDGAKAGCRTKPGRVSAGLALSNVALGGVIVILAGRWMEQGPGGGTWRPGPAAIAALVYLAGVSLVWWFFARRHAVRAAERADSASAAEARLGRLYLTLGRTNECIARGVDRKGLFSRVCAVMVESGQFKMAMISEVTGNGDSVRPVAIHRYGTLSESMAGSQDRLYECCLECAKRRVMETCDNPVVGESVAEFHKVAGFSGSAFCAAFPLRVGGKTKAVMSLCVLEVDSLSPEELEVLKKIAEDLSFALDRMENQERRRTAESALESSLALLRMMERTAGVGGWELDPETGEGQWTDEVARIYDLPVGTKPNAEMGFGFYQGESNAAIRNAVRSAIDSGTPYDLELEIRTAAGRRKWIRTICQPEVENGRVRRLRGSMQDITDKMTARVAFEQQTRLIRSLLDSIPDLIFLKDLNGVYLRCNPAFGVFAGRPVDEIEGRSDLEIFSEDAAAAFREQDQIIAESLAQKSIDEWVTTADGRRILLETIKSPFWGPDGKLLGVLGISRDITERKRIEERLRESEQRFRALVEVAPEAIFVRTGDRFSYLNAAAAKLLGCASPDRLLGERVLDRFHPDCRQSVLRRMNAADQTGDGTTEADRVLLRLDGTRVDASISAVPINYQGLPSALIFARDVSDRKRAEVALRRQLEMRDQLGRIASTVPGTIFSFRLGADGTMSVPFASAALEKLCGLRPQDLRDDATRIIDRFHPEDLRRLRESVNLTPGAPGPLRFEGRLQDSNGEYVSVEGRAVQRTETDGSVVWHGFLMDISDRKQSDEQIRKLSRAVEQSPVTVVITNINGDIEYVNPKFTELTGYSREEAMGVNPRVLKSGKTPVEEYDSLWETITKGGTWRGEFINRKKGGEEFWESASITPITDEGGRITHYLAVKEDITERKELEARFRQSQKLEGVGQLAGGVAHDFNNILSTMMIQTELSLMADGVPATVREGLEQIRSTMERASGLTRQLLMFSRKQVLQPRVLDLNEAVNNLSSLLRRVLREDVNLRLHLHPAPLMTRADAGMLDQVLMNLAINSQDAMPDGGRLVIETSERMLDEESARQCPEAAPGRYVGLTVTDTGCGMSPEVRARVFEPFFTTKEPGKGTGLGLATVFGIVKQHGGWIRFHSEPGQGSSFQIYLPVCEASPENAALPRYPKPKGGQETILLVEDDQSVRRATKALLERQGYTVLEASNGPAAIGVWNGRKDEIALLLTDLVMPAGVSGRQLAILLREDRPDLKVVFTSGYNPEITNEGTLPGITDPYLQKPCPPAALLDTLRRTLDDDPIVLPA